MRDEALALLSKVGLLDKRDAFPAKLSGGQKQRVGIARALAMRPDLLLFDEPTSALDPELVGEVLVVMRELAREGMTMVVVTHEMGFAREAASRVLFLDRGRVVETGAPDKFFARPETERARQILRSAMPARPPCPDHGAETGGRAMHPIFISCPMTPNRSRPTGPCRQAGPFVFVTGRLGDRSRDNSVPVPPAQDRSPRRAR